MGHCGTNLNVRCQTENVVIKREKSQITVSHVSEVFFLSVVVRLSIQNR